MCNKCNKSGCSCPSSEGKEIAALKNQIQELTGLVNSISDSTKAFREGHPIMCIQQASDIAKFNFTTGLGSGSWTNWALCTGLQQFSPTDNAILTTPNFLDRFLVAAGNTYSVDEIGGSNSVALIASQLAGHTHTVNDPGHTHDITDPGHNHGGSSGAHTHTITTAPHTHILDANGVHNHSKTFKVEVNANIDNTGGSSSYLVNDSGSADSSEYMVVDNSGSHTHTAENANVAATASSTAASVTITNSFVGITETVINTTGLTVNEFGDGDAHENRPPYYGVIYVIKL